MEALAAEAGALTALEAELRAELRAVRADRESAERVLQARTAERNEGRAREAELAEEEAKLRVENEQVDEELDRLRRNYAAQLIARAWFVTRSPPSTVSASPMRWASMVAGANLKSALANEGARLRLLDKLWARFGNAEAVLAGTAPLPRAEVLSAAVEAAGYPKPSEQDLSEVSTALDNDLERLRRGDEQLQERRAKLSPAALSSGRGSLDRSSPSRMGLRSPSQSTRLLETLAVGTPGKSPDAAHRALGRALAVSRVANQLSASRLGARGGTPARASAATLYASIIPALNQLKARGDGSIALRIAGATALAEAALDPQTRDAIVRADGARLLRDAIAEEQQELAPAVGLLRLEVDIALERLGQAGEG